MLHIKCPHCGLRSQNEFSYGGDATVKRPELNKEISDQDWDNYVYLRKSPRGKHLELWQHISGCRQWIKVERDTLTHEISKTLKANETGKFMDLPLAEVGIPATTGALINNQLRKKLEAMNEEQKEQNLKEFIQELNADPFYKKNPELKDKTIEAYTERMFGEKRADGGRIGYKIGSIDKARRAFLKTMGVAGAGITALKTGLLGFGKSADAVKNIPPIKTPVTKLTNSTTQMPDWFPSFINKFRDEGKEREEVFYSL